ncbi:TPA: hypothetical protein TY888_000798 [Streptococcus suis]|nr:hypothetical protein [Streptococcus suis]
MQEKKRPRGRPKGRTERKQITLDLRIEDYNYLTELAEANQSTRRQAIFDGLNLLEKKIKKTVDNIFQVEYNRDR